MKLRDILLWMAAAAGIGCIVLLALPAFQQTHCYTSRAPCKNNLKVIGLALHNYLQEYTAFPPAFIPDQSGQPKHSWRVLLLPFLGQQELYDQYRFDEPWDGPHNRLLADKLPACYRCPLSAVTPGRTNYVMVVGDGMLSDGPSATRFADLKDGTSDTIAVIEVADSDTHWMEPRDLAFHQFVLQINSDRQRSLSSHHQGGAHILTLDGSVRFQHNQFPTESLKAALTIGGGEKFDFWDVTR